jgi:hypothetical protein
MAKRTAGERRQTPLGRSARALPADAPILSGHQDGGPPSCTPKPRGLSQLLEPTEADRGRLAALEAARQDNARRFAARYGRPLEETEQAAEGGDLKALCLLIAYDKSWLFRPVTIQVIVRAEAAADRTTLQRIGAAVGRLAGHRRRSPRNAAISHARLLELEELVAQDPKWRGYLHDARFRQTILEIAEHSSLIPEGRFEPTYFRTYLKRHGLI